MALTRADELAQFTALLCAQRLPKKDCHPLVIALEAVNFFKLAAKLHRLYIAQNNRRLTDKEEDAIANLQFTIRSMADAYDLPVSFESDARGYSVRFTLPDGRSNNMGGEDWGI